MLVKEYDEVLKLANDLLALLPSIPEAYSKEKESFECSRIKLCHRKTLKSLESVIKKLDADEKEKLAKISPAPIFSGGASGGAPTAHCRDPNAQKIKVRVPRFSGKSRDFAVFKRDFNAIVAVDKRNSVEIGWKSEIEKK